MIKYLISLTKLHWLRHNWGSWETTHKGEITRSADKAVIGTFETQRRQCNTCKQVQLKNYKVDLTEN